MTGTIAQFNRFLPDRSLCAQFSCKTVVVVIGSLFLMARRSEKICPKLNTCVFVWSRYTEACGRATRRVASGCAGTLPEIRDFCAAEGVLHRAVEPVGLSGQLRGRQSTFR